MASPSDLEEVTTEIRTWPHLPIGSHAVIFVPSPPLPSDENLTVTVHVGSHQTSDLPSFDTWNILVKTFSRCLCAVIGFGSDC
ncbi:hypothetical protein V6N13_103765 [Hibiscus sabdariffa]|uniref:Uncharacterized protein n=2 Tax=Hibiscus sabdariffa TaxID=183260 RepID=A0ABR2BSP2_9ROSI